MREEENHGGEKIQKRRFDPERHPGKCFEPPKHCTGREIAENSEP
jgi:hypothetical protein